MGAVVFGGRTALAHLVEEQHKARDVQLAGRDDHDSLGN